MTPPAACPLPEIVGHRGFGAGRVPLRRVSTGPVLWGLLSGGRWWRLWRDLPSFWARMRQPATVKENTLQACQQAYAAGARWVEIDVRFSSDGVLVLHHDEAIRTAEGELVPVRELSQAQVHALGVCTLEQIHAHTPADLGLVVEVKTEPDPAATAALLAAVGQQVQAMATTRPVWVISFDERLFAADVPWPQQVPRGLNVRTVDYADLGAALAQARAVGAQLASVQAGLARPATSPHPSELELMIWDARPADWNLAQALQARFLCVDDVAGTLERARTANT